MVQPARHEVGAQRADYALSVGVVDRVVDPDGDSGDALRRPAEDGARLGAPHPGLLRRRVRCVADPALRGVAREAGRTHGGGVGPG